MNELADFARLGFRHIVDLDALDHILFLLVLAAIYRPRDWRRTLWVVSAFTVGHSLTLALAVTGLVTLPTPLIEFLIPVTIVLTGLENLLIGARVTDRGVGYRPVLAGIFGLVHGAGFANYLKALFLDRIAVPLLGFNVGIELGQIVVLLATGALLAGADRAIAAARAPYATPSAFRLRTLAVSGIVTTIALAMAVARRPW